MFFIKAKMTFTKTSQKFGQWIDFKLNLVYGLGFPNDAELNKFVEKFKEIKEYIHSLKIIDNQRLLSKLSNYLEPRSD